MTTVWHLSSFSRAWVLPLGHTATARHTKARDVNIRREGPPLFTGRGVDRDNAIKGGADHQLIFNQDRGGLP